MDLLQQLQLKHPIFLAPMAGISTPALAAEVSEQGALGSLGLGASSLSSAREQILATQQLSTAPLHLNFFCHQSVAADPVIEQNWIARLKPAFEKFSATPPTQLNCIYPSFLDNDDFLNLVLETRPALVSFHFGLPHPHQIQALKHAGILTMVSATNLVEAQLIENAGIDIINAQGVEAGGHRGCFNPEIDAAIMTADLVRLIKAHCTRPIVAAGGIMNGQQIRHMLDLGASAVQMGTAFLPAQSSNAHPKYRQTLFEQRTTQISPSISGRPARALLQHWHKEIDQPTRIEVAAYPYAYDIAKQLHAVASKHGDHGYGAFWAGSNVAQIRNLDCAALIEQLTLEMTQS